MGAASGNVVEVKGLDELDRIHAEATAEGKLVVLDTYATWCGPCKVIAPFFAGLSVNPGYEPLAVFCKVDVDAAEDVAAALMVRAMPTFYVFWEGKQVDTLTGANPEKIKEMIDRQIEAILSEK